MDARISALAFGQGASTNPLPNRPTSAPLHRGGAVPERQQLLDSAGASRKVHSGEAGATALGLMCGPRPRSRSVQYVASPSRAGNRRQGRSVGQRAGASPSVQEDFRTPSEGLADRHLQRLRSSLFAELQHCVDARDAKEHMLAGARESGCGSSTTPTEAMRSYTKKQACPRGSSSLSAATTRRVAGLSLLMGCCRTFQPGLSMAGWCRTRSNENALVRTLAIVSPYRRTGKEPGKSCKSQKCSCTISWKAFNGQQLLIHMLDQVDRGLQSLANSRRRAEKRKAAP